MTNYQHSTTFNSRSLFFTATLSLASLLFSLGGTAQSAEITIDGVYEDWTDNLATLTDSDEELDGVDLLEMQVSNDDEFLFIHIRTNTEFDLTENLIAQRVRLYLDTDNDASTGFEIQEGYGAELGVVFRDLFAHYNVEPYTTVNFSSISLRAAPTVTSNEFEIAIKRDAIPDGIHPLFPGSTIKILLLNDLNGDRLPNVGQTFSYEFDETPVPDPDVIDLEKGEDEHIRVVAYNVLANGLTDNDRLPHFENIVSILNPNIIGFSECGNTSAQEVKTLLDDWLPQGTDEGWYVQKKADSDLISASIWPFLDAWDSVDRQYPVLIDLPDEYETDLLFTNSHLSCCGNNDGRQDQVDQYAAFILDAKTAGGVIDLAENTPIVYGGDLNLVGYAQQLKTLVTGDIQNTILYGEGAPLDWDETDLADPVVLQSDIRMDYTWRQDDDGFPPGKLDFIIFSDATLNEEKAFVVQTEEMSEERRLLYGFDENDTSLASDHFPVVSDFSLVETIDVDQNTATLTRKIYPNPAAQKLYIREPLQTGDGFSLITLNGEEVIRTVVSGSLSAIDVSGLASGMYILRIYSGNNSSYHKVLIER